MHPSPVVCYPRPERGVSRLQLLFPCVASARLADRGHVSAQGRRGLLLARRSKWWPARVLSCSTLVAARLDPDAGCLVASALAGEQESPAAGPQELREGGGKSAGRALGHVRRALIRGLDPPSEGWRYSLGASPGSCLSWRLGVGGLLPLGLGASDGWLTSRSGRRRTGWVLYVLYDKQGGCCMCCMV